MTLLVVDQFRTTADSYAVITDHDTQETYYSEWCKIATMPGVIKHEYGHSFDTLAFVGDATAFSRYRDILTHRFEQLPADSLVLPDDILVETATAIGDCGYTQVVIPCSSAVLVVSFGDGETPELEYRTGAVHAFGSDYDRISEEPETRAWFSIFIDAKRANRLMGDQIHFKSHTDLEIKTDTLKPASKVKRFRSRSPFKRRCV